VTQEQQDQINADHLLALALERKDNLRLRAQLADAEARGRVDAIRSKSAAKTPIICTKSVKDRFQSGVVAGKLASTHLGVTLGTDRASSKLPERSGLHRAMRGDGGKSEPSDSSSSDSDDHRGNGPEDSSDSGSDESINYNGRDLFRKAPGSDHSSDSKDTKRRKSERRKRYRAKLQEIKFQQSFLKQEPPFKYGGEVQASLFKKWVREVRSWIKRGRLSTKQGIMTSGQYCVGKAYQFFERDVLSSRKKYTLTEYFEAMFDYIFPATFRMDQRDKFNACWQLDLPALDFLRKLHDIADTVGDLEEDDIILGFWRRCKPYLKSKLAEAGLEPGRITLTELENLVMRLETAHLIAEAATKQSYRLDSQTAAPRRPNRGPPTVQPEKKPAWKPKSFGTGQGNAARSRPNRSPGNFGSSLKSHSDKERTKRLREEGRCFRCESKDHMLKDCPERHNTKPPMKLGAVGMQSATETRLAALEEGSSSGLFVIGYPKSFCLLETVNSETVELRTAKRDLLVNRALYLLRSAVPLPFDQCVRPVDSPYSPSRFRMIEYGGEDTLLLLDDHNNDNHVLYCSWLANPDFDLLNWLHIEKSKIFDELDR
jgi:hypothetical protein